MRREAAQREEDREVRRRLHRDMRELNRDADRMMLAGTPGGLLAVIGGVAILAGVVLVAVGVVRSIPPDGWSSVLLVLAGIGLAALGAGMFYFGSAWSTRWIKSSQAKADARHARRRAEPD